MCLYIYIYVLDYLGNYSEPQKSLKACKRRRTLCKPYGCWGDAASRRRSQFGRKHTHRFGLREPNTSQLRNSNTWTL